MADLIRDPVTITRGATTVVVSPITLASGRTLADWSSFVLTARADPRWPRKGSDASAASTAVLDPAGDGWPEAASVAGAVVGSTLEFDVAAYTFAPGAKRYAFDVYGIGGTAGDSPLVTATWLTVLPDVR